MAANKCTPNDVQNACGVVFEQLQAALAICDAIEILAALERAPEHQDCHPSHDIKTGGGYAHDLKTKDVTLPILANHVKTLIDMSINDVDCMREEVINSLREKSHC